jgi:hypothetical protein
MSETFYYEANKTKPEISKAFARSEKTYDICIHNICRDYEDYRLKRDELAKLALAGIDVMSLGDCYDYMAFSAERRTELESADDQAKIISSYADYYLNDPDNCPDDMYQFFEDDGICVFPEEFANLLLEFAKLSLPDLEYKSTSNDVPVLFSGYGYGLFTL